MLEKVNEGANRPRFKKIVFVSDYPFALAAFFAAYMMVFALFYQHVLGYEPCELCIHIRMIVAVMFALSTIATFWSWKPFRRFTIASIFLAYAFIFERNWSLLMHDLGLSDAASCGPVASLPEWMPLDVWMPKFFAIEAVCGSTPPVFFDTIPMSTVLGMISIICPLLVFHVYRTVRDK